MRCLRLWIVNRWHDLSERWQSPVRHVQVFRPLVPVTRSGQCVLLDLSCGCIYWVTAGSLHVRVFFCFFFSWPESLFFFSPCCVAAVLVYPYQWSWNVNREAGGCCWWYETLVSLPRGIFSSPSCFIWLQILHYISPHMPSNSLFRPDLYLIENLILLSVWNQMFHTPTDGHAPAFLSLADETAVQFASLRWLSIPALW